MVSPRLRGMLPAMAALLMAVAAHAAVPVNTMDAAPEQRVRSLQLTVNDNMFAPRVLVLGANDRLRVDFDVLGDDRDYLRYRLIHCLANWQPDGLVDNEYLDGFNEAEIEDYAFSRATTVHYVHYTLTIPNDDMAPMLSGNYLLQIYSEDDPDQIWAQCRFMVSEQSVGISATVTSRTDVDYNRGHQQLQLAIDTRRGGVSDPFNDLYVVIQQNGRYDNETALRQPLRMSGTTSIYEHQPQLIFEAGNEYRRFEAISTQFPGMHIDYIDYTYPYYYTVLQTDTPRADSEYLYDSTQHGRYLVREFNSTDPTTEADYVVVLFSLDAPYDPSVEYYIDGDLTMRSFNADSHMVYNSDTGRYERAMLLKQGAYNYQYLAVPRGATRGYTARVEGDKYQTVNEYTVKVYERRPGSRYDRLLGVSTIINDH